MRNPFFPQLNKTKLLTSRYAQNYLFPPQQNNPTFRRAITIDREGLINRNAA